MSHTEDISMGEPALPLVFCSAMGEGEIPSSYLIPHLLHEGGDLALGI